MSDLTALTFIYNESLTNMQPSNFHSHCIFCDGRSYPEDYIKFALSANFRAYGFSSHSPLPFETCWNMSAADMPAYLNEIARLKEKYKDRIEIYTGLEIDCLDETYNASIPYFQELPLDYRISSIHFIPWRQPLLEANMTCIDGSYSDFHTAIEERYRGNIRAVVADYYHSSMRMVESGGFDIVGHMDKIYMNAGRHPDFDRDADWYGRLLEEYIRLIAEKALIVEINTKNYLRKQQTFPHLSLFSLLKKYQIPVMVNTDSHFPELIHAGRTDVLQLLKAAGYRTTRELVNGKWEDIEI